MPTQSLSPVVPKGDGSAAVAAEEAYVKRALGLTAFHDEEVRK